MDYTLGDIAKMIDHSLLNPTLTAEDMDLGIQIALDYDVASVCILPCYLKRCAQRLAGSAVVPSTTIGFPHGGHTTAVKVAEARQALADGKENYYRHLELPYDEALKVAGDAMSRNLMYKETRGKIADFLGDSPSS